MLKTIGSLNKLAPGKNNNSKSGSSKNNNSQLLERMTIMVRLDLVVIVWSILKSQENQKAKI